MPKVTVEKKEDEFEKEGRVELTESNVHALGILMPTLSYRFRFQLNNDDANIIARQLTDLKLDYVNKLLTIYVIQPLGGFDLHDYLLQTIRDDHIGVITTYNGTEEEGQKVVMNLRALEHEFILDYDSEEVAKHKIVFDIL